MTVMITGANGFLAKEIKKHILIGKSINLTRDQYKNQNIEDLIIKKKISKIIHCANLYRGYKKEILKINFIYAKKLFCASYNKKIKFYYFDTIYPKLKNISKKKYNYNYLISKKKFINYVKQNIKHKKITFINIITPTVFGFNSQNNDLSSQLIKALKKNQKFIIHNPKKIKKFLSIEKFLLDFKKIYKKKKLLHKYYKFHLKPEINTSIIKFAFFLKEKLNSRSYITIR